MGPCFRRDDVVWDRAKSLRLEKTVRRLLGGPLLGHGGLQPFDLRRHQRDAFGEFLDRQQRQVLPDLVADFLPRFVVVLARHELSSVCEVRSKFPWAVASRTAAGSSGASSSFLT